MGIIHLLVIQIAFCFPSRCVKHMMTRFILQKLFFKLGIKIYNHIAQNLARSNLGNIKIIQIRNAQSLLSKQIPH